MIDKDFSHWFHSEIENKKISHFLDFLSFIHVVLHSDLAVFL